MAGQPFGGRFEKAELTFLFLLPKPLLRTWHGFWGHPQERVGVSREELWPSLALKPQWPLRPWSVHGLSLPQHPPPSHTLLSISMVPHSREQRWGPPIVLSWLITVAGRPCMLAKQHLDLGNDQDWEAMLPRAGRYAGLSTTIWGWSFFCGEWRVGEACVAQAPFPAHTH